MVDTITKHNSTKHKRKRREMNNGADPSPVALLSISAAALGVVQNDGAASSYAAIVAAVHRAWARLVR